MHSLNINFRGQELIDKIIENISDDKIRMTNIAIKELIKSKIVDKSSYSEYMNVHRQIINDKQLIDDYIKNNDIKLTVIDKEFLTKTII